MTTAGTGSASEAPRKEQHSLTVNSTPDTAYTADTAVTAMQDTVRHRGDCTAVVTLCASKDIKDAHAAAQHCASDTTPQTDQSCGGVDAVALQVARAHVATFAAPNNRRGACVVGLTFALGLGLLTFGSWWFKQSAALTWWGLALSGLWLVARMGSYVRAFVLTHDAIHNAVFSKRLVNEWVAILTGLLTATDAPDYRRTHGQHHALLGIEEESQRDPDLIVLWTTQEWANWPRGLSKAAARVMIDPLFLFTVMAPIWILAFNVSWPTRVTTQAGQSRMVHVMYKLLMLVGLYVAAVWLFAIPPAGIWAELLAQQLAMSYAMFLYAVEHSFEGVYRVPRAEYNRTAGGLLGSSFLSIPWCWSWVTLGIEYHHIHHLNARVPCYRLKACQDSAPPGLWEAAGVRKLGARDGFRALVLSLWDADARCYVPFPEWAWLDRLLAAHPHQTVGHGKEQ